MCYVTGHELSTRNVEMNWTGPDLCPHNLNMQITILSGKCNNGTRYKSRTKKRGVNFIFLGEGGNCSQLGNTL